MVSFHNLHPPTDSSGAACEQNTERDERLRRQVDGPGMKRADRGGNLKFLRNDGFSPAEVCREPAFRPFNPRLPKKYLQSFFSLFIQADDAEEKQSNNLLRR